MYLNSSSSTNAGAARATPSNTNYRVRLPSAPHRCGTCATIPAQLRRHAGGHAHARALPRRSAPTQRVSTATGRPHPKGNHHVAARRGAALAATRQVALRLPDGFSTADARWRRRPARPPRFSRPRSCRRAPRRSARTTAPGPRSRTRPHRGWRRRNAGSSPCRCG